MERKVTRRIVKRRTIKGFWNCKYCGTTKIDGLVDFCPNCGVHKPDDTNNDLDKNNIVEVSKEELAAAGIVHSEDGTKRPEWKCPYCNSFNNYLDNSCSSCGASKSESKEDYFGPTNCSEKEKVEEKKEIFEEKVDNVTNSVSKKEYYKGVYFEDRTSRRAPSISEVASFFENENDKAFDNSFFKNEDKNKSFLKNLSFRDNIFRKRTNNNFNWVNLFKIAGIGSLIFLFSFLLIYLLKPYEVTTTVDGFYWERNIYIEEMQTVKESGWSVPSGARVYDEKEEFFDYDKVVDYYEEIEVEKEREVFSHYEYDYKYETEYIDNGDGTYDEVVIETKIETPVYVIEKYTDTESRPVYKDVPIYKTKYYYEIDKWNNKYSRNSSGTDKSPYWNNNYTLASNQRDTSKTETYIIYYSNGEQKISNYSEWMNTELGSSVTIVTCKLGIVYSQK